MSLIPLLTVVGVIISVVVGMVWYSPKTPMGKIHLQYLGHDKLSPEEQQAWTEGNKPKMKRLLVAQILLSVLMSFAVVFIVTMSIQNGMTVGMAMGFIGFNWLFFMVPAIGGNILWSDLPGKLASKKFLSDSLNFLVTLLLIAGVTSLFV